MHRAICKVRRQEEEDPAVVLVLRLWAGGSFPPCWLSAYMKGKQAPVIEERMKKLTEEYSKVDWKAEIERMKKMS